MVVSNAAAAGKPNNESHQDRSFGLIRLAAKQDYAVAAWLDRYLRRDAEALYDLDSDPSCRVNVADNPAHADTLVTMRAHVRHRMAASDDPMLRMIDRDPHVTEVVPFEKP